LIEPITYRWEFELLRDAGRYRRSGPLSIRRVLDHELDESVRVGSGVRAEASSVRVAYAIGRHVGNAVVRNRLRRRLRAALRQLDSSEMLADGRYLIIPSADVLSMSFNALHRDLLNVMRDDATSRVRGG